MTRRHLHPPARGPSPTRAGLRPLEQLLHGKGRPGRSASFRRLPLELRPWRPVTGPVHGARPAPCLRTATTRGTWRREGTRGPQDLTLSRPRVYRAPDRQPELDPGRPSCLCPLARGGLLAVAGKHSRTQLWAKWFVRKLPGNTRPTWRETWAGAPGDWAWQTVFMPPAQGLAAVPVGACA